MHYFYDRTAEPIEFDTCQSDNPQFDRGIPFVGVIIELTLENKS